MSYYNEYYKEWYRNNKKRKQKYNKEYTIRNKDKSREYYIKNKNRFNEKFNCDCGGKFTKSNISAHIKTKKHVLYTEIKKINECGDASKKYYTNNKYIIDKAVNEYFLQK